MVAVVGEDRPGIVAGVTRVLYEHGCNLEDVSSTILRGRFAMMLIVEAPDGTEPASLETSLQPVAGEMELILSVREVGQGHEGIAEPTHMVAVYGADKPGIVFRVADVLAEAGVNVTDLNSRVIGDPEDPVYALMIEVSAEEGLDLAAILDPVKTELAVEISVNPIDTNVL